MQHNSASDVTPRLCADSQSVDKRPTDDLAVLSTSGKSCSLYAQYARPISYSSSSSSPSTATEATSGSNLAHNDGSSQTTPERCGSSRFQKCSSPFKQTLKQELAMTELTRPDAHAARRHPQLLHHAHRRLPTRVQRAVFGDGTYSDFLFHLSKTRHRRVDGRVGGEVAPSRN